MSSDNDSNNVDSGYPRNGNGFSHTNNNNNTSFPKKEIDGDFVVGLAGDGARYENHSRKRNGNKNHSYKENSNSEDELDIKSENESERSFEPEKKKKKKDKDKKKKDKKAKKRQISDSEDDYKEEKKSKKKKKKDIKSEDEDDFSDYEVKKKKDKKDKKDKDKDKDKKSKVKKTTKSGKVKKEEPRDSSPEKKGRKKKVEDEEHIWKWWEEERPGEGIKWRTLEHQGPVFPPDYEPLPPSVRFYYDGKPMKLSPETEEVATFYAKMLDHDYTSKSVFNNNFFGDWRKVMTKEEKTIINDLSKCNFKEMDAYFKEQSEKRKSLTKEEKEARKKENEGLVNKYGVCLMDGHKQKIGNFRIEPPGLFRGRGEHPKMGKLKKRVQAEDIILNIGKEAKVPTPPAGHKWKEVRHDNTVTWLASWTENIMGNVKYIMLNPSSKMKSIKDWQKYEKARELKKFVDKIRADYRNDFRSKEMVKRQRAVALYFIDNLALRAGNEKDDGETADTVGCCSLRYEHITLHEEKDGEQYVVEFDFLGKDSIRYQNSVPVEKRVFKNLKHFMSGKQEGDDLFDRLNTASLNKYLNSLMDGLTAKVFRTFNASNTLQDQLNKLTKDDMNVPELMLAYNRANRAVAILCNHQRAVPKTFEKQMENLEEKIKDKKKSLKEAKKEYKDAKKSDKAKADKMKKKVATLEDQLKKLEVQRTDKEENKQIALGTSKLNYLDPRISVAWCKKWNVPIEKVYNKTQRDKFRWAIEMVDADYQF